MSIIFHPIHTYRFRIGYVRHSNFLATYPRDIDWEAVVGPNISKIFFLTSCTQLSASTASFTTLSHLFGNY